MSPSFSKKQKQIGRTLLLASNSNRFLFFALRLLLFIRCLLLTPPIAIRIIIINIRFIGRKKAIFYFGAKSGYYNVEKIITLLLLNKPEWKIVFCSPQHINIPIKATIQKNIYELSLDFLNLCCLKGDLFLSPTDIPYKVIKPMHSTGVYFVHSLVGIKHISHDHSFDGSDYIFAAGPKQRDDFVANFKKRNKKGPIVIPGGYPKLDYLFAKREQLRKRITTKKTAVIAPTYNNCHNSEFVILKIIPQIADTLLKHNYRVIIRPHPLSFHIQKELLEIQRIMDYFSNETRVILDRSKDYYPILDESSMMISDISGTAYTYAMSFLKPVIFYSPTQKPINAFHFQDRSRIGKVAHSIPEFDRSVQFIENNYLAVVDGIIQYRKQSISNIGYSSEYFMSIFNILNQHGIPAGATRV